MIDALLPAEMAQKAEQVGIRKAALDSWTLLALSVLAGAFISLGAVFATTVTTGAMPYGVARLLGGVAFSLGLILVVVGGAELFTGNNLLVMAWAGGRISARALLRNWVLVYLGNLLGTLATVGLVFLARHHTLGGGAVGVNALGIAQAKCQLDFLQAVALGVLGNALVCLAVWLCFSARSTADRLLAVLFPVSAFVAAGFEHSVANMYFVPAGLVVKGFAAPGFWSAAGRTAADYPDLSWPAFLARNLVPVTIGNVLGGGVLVGLVYWFVYLRRRVG